MEIGKIRLELIQTRILVATKDGELWRSDKTLKTVASTVISLPANRKDRFPDHVDSLCESEIRDEALRFSINFGTSQGVYNRVQTVNHQKIKVKHVLQVTVDLIDPEGHSSKVSSSSFNPDTIRDEQQFLLVLDQAELLPQVLYSNRRWCPQEFAGCR